MLKKIFFVLFSFFLAESVFAGEKTVYDITPDTPVSFGYKVNWFAIRTTDAQKVIRVLGSDQVEVANWNAGIGKAYKGEYDKKTYPVFISPAVEGWVFVVGKLLPYPTDISADPSGREFQRLFKSLYTQFEEVQYFGSYRVVGFESWAIAKSGHVLREFAFSDEGVLRNYGDMTEAEKQLGFVDISGLTLTQATEKVFQQAEIFSRKDEKLRKQGNKTWNAVQYPHVLKNGEVVYWTNNVNVLGRAIPSEGDAQTMSHFWSFNPSLFDVKHFSKSVGFVAWMKSYLKNKS